LTDTEVTAVPIHFRCVSCNKRLSVGTRKAGTVTTCPNCAATITVPRAESAESPATAATRRFPINAVAIAFVLLACIGAVAALALRKPAAPVVEQARIDPVVAVVPVVPVTPQATAPQPPSPSQKSQDNPPRNPTLQPTEPQLPQPPSVSPTQQPTLPEIDPPPHAVAQSPQPPQPQPVAVPDKFGNPTGNDIGLGKDGEFKGKRLLFWSGFENAGKVFFGPTNPLWKALEAKGFVVRREFGRFKPEWLKDTDQLWVLSTGRIEFPAGITPELLEFALTQLPADAVPSGFTLPEYQFIVRATLDVALGPVHPLDAKAYTAIMDFVKAGKGLCLLSDDEPFCVESNELAKRLFGTGVAGNYVADKIASVRGKGLTAADIRKFGGQYEVDDHALLSGVNFLFEGITVSNVGASDKLEVALKASDGKALIAVSKVPGQRVVIDCGFTRYCHGPTERTSYILKTAGTVRLAQNIAAYLEGKGEVKK